MAYEVLARKWRPQQFDDVVGQDHVTQTLANAIASDRIAHAYLFVGPRGIGKTSIARIFAKALNCLEKGPTDHPCDQCDSCKEVMAGRSLDVIEIDGASNTGVDNVRDLRDTVKFAPARAKFKIYIIDEVHMLSASAFNALLKTLEEPPPHVKFFFATTEPEKILPTIISRCQRFDLRRISVPDIVERLDLIAKADNVKVDNDALLAIARGSEGGLRDAESALDQLIAFCGKTICEKDVLGVFGLVARETMEQLAENVLTGNVKELIQIVGDLDRAGKDLQRLVLEVMDHFRMLLVCINVDDPGSGLDLTPQQVETMQKQAALTDTSKLLRITEVLTDAESRMRYTLSRRTLLETALIRCAKAATLVSLDEVLRRLNELRAGGDEAAAPQEKAEARKRPAAPYVETARVRESPVEAPAKTPAAVPAKTPAAEPSKELALLTTGWHDIVSVVSRIAVSARGALLDARPVNVDDTTVTIGLDASFSEEIDSFKSPRIRAAVQRAVSRALGRDVAVAFTIAEDRPVDQPAVPSASYDIAASEPDRVKESAAPAKKARKGFGDWNQEPAVQEVLEMFSGTIVDVRE